MSAEPPFLLDTKRLARRWQMSPRTLEAWRQQGRGPPFLRIGRRILFRLTDVEAFERNAAICPPAPGRKRP